MLANWFTTRRIPRTTRYCLRFVLRWHLDTLEFYPTRFLVERVVNQKKRPDPLRKQDSLEEIVETFCYLHIDLLLYNHSAYT